MAVTVLTHPEDIELPSPGVAADDIIARRKALHALAEQRDAQASAIDLTRETAEPVKPREPIDSVMIATPAGEVEFGPPPGISLTMRIASMMGETNPNRTTHAMLRTLMCVRSIDGKPVTPVTNMVEATHLSNMLGDGVLDFLYSVLVDNWPPPAPADLQVVRKNKRIS
jgi:hypothetical protein